MDSLPRKVVVIPSATHKDTFRVKQVSGIVDVPIDVDDVDPNREKYVIMPGGVLHIDQLRWLDSYGTSIVIVSK